jgi:hypothetical protein
LVVHLEIEDCIEHRNILYIDTRDCTEPLAIPALEIGDHIKHPKWSQHSDVTYGTTYIVDQHTYDLSRVIRDDIEHPINLYSQLNIILNL